MAAATTVVPESASQADASPEPAAPEPVVAAVEPAPAAPAPAGATAQPAAQSDSFAMKGYGSSATKQPSAGAEGGQGGAAQAASGQPGPADAAQGAQDGNATVDASMPADPAAQASAVPVPDGSNRSYGPSGAGFPAADTEPEMCKYGGCSFR
jgi:hypothetical protein